MCSWSDSGDRSNMKKYTCGPTTQSPRRGIRSPGTSTFTTHADPIRALTGKHPIRPTSSRFRRSRRLEPGRRSTYPLKILFRQTEPPHPSQFGIGFVPLGFTAPLVGLRHVGFLDQQPKCPFAVTNVIAYRRFRDRVARHLRQDAAINPTRRMALLARGLPVRLQNAVDEPCDRSQPRPGSLAVCANRRKRTVHCLAHEPAVDPKLPGDTLDRADPEFILAAQLLE